MKTVLVILSQANLSNFSVNESLSATMVLATFGCKVKILLCQEGLSLLRNQQAFNTVEHAFKLANNIVESFEFYDLFPILIDQNDRESAFVKNTQYELEYVELCRDFLDEFDHILYW